MTKPNQALIKLSDDSQLNLIQTLLTQSNINIVNLAKKSPTTSEDIIQISNFVDGRGLACPQPLLRTKIALRKTPQGDFVYLVATDSNSLLDLQAFAKQNNQNLSHWKLNSLENNLTIFHFLIQA